MKLENGKTIMQIGIVTSRAVERGSMQPLNLVMVIDRSGSMAGEKLNRGKQSMQQLVENFRPNDRISFVTFDHNACVHLAATPRTNIAAIIQSINSIAVSYTHLTLPTNYSV